MHIPSPRAQAQCPRSLATTQSMSSAECQARNYIWMIGGKWSCCHDLPQFHPRTTMATARSIASPSARPAQLIRCQLQRA